MSDYEAYMEYLSTVPAVWYEEDCLEGVKVVIWSDSHTQRHYVYNKEGSLIRTETVKKEMWSAYN